MRPNVAVLLLVFRRPRLTLQVIQQLRLARPAILLVAADAPKNPEDDSLCRQTRELVAANVDWPCKVVTRYATEHLGCKRAVSSAITWAFSLYEQVIVLEDDCVPEPSFFQFCDEMLERYAEDERVMQVCGSNLTGLRKAGESYHFSRLVGPIWGWASWRRAWKWYDPDIDTWPTHRRAAWIKNQCRQPFEMSWRRELFDSVYGQCIDTWDYQWVYAKMQNGGLNVIPSCNMIVNVGFGADATHTRASDDPRGRVLTQTMPFPLQHPNEVSNWEESGRVYLREVVGLPSSRWSKAALIHVLKCCARRLRRWLPSSGTILTAVQLA